MDATMNRVYIQWELDIFPISCNDGMIFRDILDVKAQYWLRQVEVHRSAHYMLLHKQKF